MSNTRPPAEPASKAVWTSKDEASLRELSERKARIMQENLQRLLDVLRPALDMALPTGADEEELNAVAEALVGGAEAFRDALAPFDSREQR